MLETLITIAVLHWAVLILPGFNFLLIGQLAAAGKRSTALAARSSPPMKHGKRGPATSLRWEKAQAAVTAANEWRPRRRSPTGARRTTTTRTGNLPRCTILPRR